MKTSACLPVGVSLGLLLALGALAQSPPSTEQLLARAKVSAAKDHKAIFVHFGASWCGWCRRLEAFLESPEIRPIFNRHFVDVKLVVQEREGNKKLENQGVDRELKRLGGPAGLPFHAFLDANGTLIVNSLRPESGNIGHPVAPEEVQWFLTMVDKAAPRLSATERKTIEEWLSRRKR